MQKNRINPNFLSHTSKICRKCSINKMEFYFFINDYTAPYWAMLHSNWAKVQYAAPFSSYTAPLKLCWILMTYWTLDPTELYCILAELLYAAHYWE